MGRPTTTSFYDANARTFFRDTVDIDMSPLYSRFLHHLAPGAHILDAGCGSARDALAFKRLGYRVTAFDASPELAELASAHLGQPVEVLAFQELDRQNEFDAIWACASLLHVARDELPEVFARLARALKPEGILYCSFKYGRGERLEGRRRFTDLDEDGLAALLRSTPQLRLIESWQSTDLRAGREHQRWLNALIPATGSAGQTGVRKQIPRILETIVL